MTMLAGSMAAAKGANSGSCITACAAAVADAQYFGHSLEYRFLQAAIATIGHRSLLGPESRRFTGSESLVQSGLLQPIVKGP